MHLIGRVSKATTTKILKFIEIIINTVTPQVNFPQKITFDMLYTNEFVIRVRSRALAIPSERTTI